MSKKPFNIFSIGGIKNFLSLDECLQVISYQNNKNIIRNFINSSVIDSNNQITKDNKIRNTNSGFIEVSKETEWLYERLSDFSKMISQTLDLETNEIEPIQLSRYSEIERGFYRNHVDVLPFHRNSQIRKISVSVQLTESKEYEGGDLIILKHHDNLQKIKADRTIGSLTFFSSLLNHEVTPVTKGNRYSLVAWICGPKFK